MELHVSKKNIPRFLVVDSEERVCELGTRFLQSLERQRARYAPLSLDRYAQRLTHFLGFLEQSAPKVPGVKAVGLKESTLGKLRIDDSIRLLSLDDADSFYAALKDRRLKPGTIQGYEVVVKLFANWLTTSDAGKPHSISIYEGVKWRTAKEQTVVPKFVLKDTVIALLKCMHIEEHRIAAHFLYDTGARVSELARARKSDLPNPDHYPDKANYLPLFLRGSKGRGGVIKERYTVISRPMLHRINLYHNSPEYKFKLRGSDQEKPLFLNADANPLSSKAVQKAISDAVARSCITEKISSHRLRHGMAVSVLSSNMGRSMLDNLLMLQQALGHSKLSTTQIYTTIPVAALQQIREANQTLGRDRIHDADDIYQQTYVPKRLTSPNRHGPKRRS